MSSHRFTASPRAPALAFETAAAVSCSPVLSITPKPQRSQRRHNNVVFCVTPPMDRVKMRLLSFSRFLFFSLCNWWSSCDVHKLNWTYCYRWVNVEPRMNGGSDRAVRMAADVRVELRIIWSPLNACNPSKSLLTIFLFPPLSKKNIHCLIFFSFLHDPSLPFKIY